MRITNALWASLRRECLDHMLILNTRHLHKMVSEYVSYYNRMRPHQGIGQHIPEPEAVPAIESASTDRIISRSILSGLHHYHRRAA